MCHNCHDDALLQSKSGCPGYCQACVGMLAGWLAGWLETCMLQCNGGCRRSDKEPALSVSRGASPLLGSMLTCHGTHSALVSEC